MSGILARRHDGSESANVVIVLAHEAAGGSRLVLGVLYLGVVVCLVDLIVEHCFLLDEDVVAVCEILGHLYVVAHLAFQANVGYESHTSFCVYARQVSGIGVAVGVAVLNIKQVHEIDSVI